MLERQPTDAQAREEALDTSRSWIVQAPAGAGKTELLTTRFLALLAEADEPEEVLAITFTRAATAEMLARVLHWLGAARHARTPAPDEPRILTMARRALARAEERDWRLLEQPQRLDIQTIDSVAMRFAHSQPLLARLGGRLDPVDDAREPYQQAAEQTLRRLGDPANPALHAALEHLLLMRDNNLADTRRLIADMLAHRDQWAHVFPLSAAEPVDWDSTRTRLERPFAETIERALAEVRDRLLDTPADAAELVALGRYAARNQGAGLEPLLDLENLPPAAADALDQWHALARLLLTNEGTFRKQFTRKQGFPSDGTLAEKTEGKRIIAQMNALVRRLEAASALGDALATLSELPAPRYDDAQWYTLEAVFRVLRHAAAELRVAFAERNHVDFIELGLAAEQVLAADPEAGASSRAAEQAASAIERKRHLLVDEFQDTSRRQHTFLSLLLREWQPGDGRTVFLVGDPMQSIYLFRQAEYELFHHVQQHGIPCGPHTHRCDTLTLEANFRSHSGLVTPLNRHFEEIFRAPANSTGALSFSPSTAVREGEPAVHLHALIAETEDEGEAATTEARAVVTVIEQHLLRAEAARLAGRPEYRIAVLVRGKAHLARVLPALRRAAIPYRAIELEPLTDRQEILDLLSLMRALLLPEDRLAWLSVLRAPWCGLRLRDLHLLTGSDSAELRFSPVRSLLAERAALLSEDAQQRLAPTLRTLDHALEHRFRGNQSFAAWLEETWHRLGGPLTLTASELENTRVFFRLLDRQPRHGMPVLGSDFRAALESMCAEPDLAASPTHGVELLTIHKSKGLGFDVVLVPGLERAPGSDQPPLVTLLERFRPSDPLSEEVLMAPIGARGETHRTYKWIERQRRARESEERKRLLYVASTRAREELHLFGTATVTGRGELSPGDARSLLQAAWPAFRRDFEDALATRIAAAPAQAADATEPAQLPEPPLPALPLRRVATLPEAPPEVQPPASAALADRFIRPEGSRAARTLGTVVHALLAHTSGLLARGARDAADAIEPELRRRALQLLRQAGVTGTELERLLRESVSAALATADDPLGRWTLLAHPEARSEHEWTTSADGRLRVLRADRTFLAGTEPLSTGTDVLWIIDYKTASISASSPGIEEHLSQQQEQYRPQLEAYGRAALAARRARDADPITLCYALYFPGLGRMLHWHSGVR